MNEPLPRAATEFLVFTHHVFQFKGVELFPTIEEFGAITGEHNFGAIILSTLKEDLSNLVHKLLGVHLAMPKRWCKSNKLNVSMVFKYFSKKNVPLIGLKCSHHLNAFCLCILARLFLVHETPHVDPGILHVDKHLGSRSPIAIILVENLNGLDVIHGKETTFFEGSPHLLRV